ncbi:hypothetical protein K7432_014664 [Basidiobolus ranarum]|uniref:Monopolin complex subunit Csm1/Pcs1 C-terminal domain-containing protein n=1 Tax=Basidiobolus ranarum TaxID=34480 RepID=A0ABR2WH95_9FUNG
MAFYKSRRNTSGKKKTSKSVKARTNNVEKNTDAKTSYVIESDSNDNEVPSEAVPYKQTLHAKKKSRKSVSFGTLSKDLQPESPEFSVLVSPPRDRDMVTDYTVDHSPIPPRKKASVKTQSPNKSRKSTSAALDKAKPETIKKTTVVKEDIVETSDDIRKVKRQYRDLLERYEDLKQIGIQDAEANFGEYKRNAEDRFKFSDDVINQLKGQIATLKKSKVNSEEERLIEKQREELEVLRSQVEHAESLQFSVDPKQDDLSLSLALYRELADLKIRHVESEEDMTVWECEQSGRNGDFRYLLRLEHEDPDTYHFEPILEKDTALLQILPAYLTEAISFSKNDAGVFFWKLFNSLQQDS